MKILNDIFPINFTCNDASIKQKIQEMKIIRKKVTKSNKKDLLNENKETDPRDE